MYIDSIDHLDRLQPAIEDKIARDLDERVFLLISHNLNGAVSSVTIERHGLPQSASPHQMMLSGFRRPMHTTRHK